MRMYIPQNGDLGNIFAMKSMDAVDTRILHALQHDARLSIADLAAQAGLSPTACWRRLRLLEERGVIDRYVTLLDPAAVDLSVNVFVSISLEKQVGPALAAFEAAIRDRPEVMECYLMTGDSDYLLRVVVPDLASYERFVMDHLTGVPGIASIRSSFALRPVKYGTALPLGHLAASGGEAQRRRRPERARPAGQEEGTPG
jgi:DNA-binding Lrp family transcriptional regulator